MKSKRHNKILEIIESESVETQEELIERLEAEGFSVTQATVSRDIRELKLTKVMGEDGKYKYILPRHQSSGGHYAYSSTLAAYVVSVECAVNLVVVKTYPGMAQAVAAGLDSMSIPGVLGCVAGDDTIFLAVRDVESAAEAADDIRKMSGK